MSILRYYSVAYILFKRIVLQNYASFTDCIGDKILTFTKYSDSYSKTSGRLWQYYRNDPALINDSGIIDADSNSASFIVK